MQMMKTSQAPSSITLKALMAASGLLMALWLTLHMLGNLLVFAGPELMNSYALKLRATGLLLPMRVGLTALVLVHIACAIATTQRSRQARPVRYGHRARPLAASWASRSMRLGGLLLAGFLVYHVGHMYGLGHAAYVPGDVHHNLVHVLRSPPHALLYLAAVSFTALHLAHGLGSALCSLGGLTGPRQQRTTRLLYGWAWLVTAGFALQVLLVALGG